MPKAFNKTTAPEAGGWYERPDVKEPVQLPAQPAEIEKYEAKGYKFLGYVQP